MAVYVQTNQPVVIALIASPYQVVDSDTGKLFLIGPQLQELDINLPVNEAGLHYRFQTKVAGVALAHSVNIGYAGAEDIYGTIFNVAEDVLVVQGVSTINFTGGNVDPCSIGDTIDLYCDGTNWLVSAYAQLTGAITVSD